MEPKNEPRQPGTVRRLGADDALDISQDGKPLATIERAGGGRFRVLIAGEKRLDVKRRKRKPVAKKRPT